METKKETFEIAIRIMQVLQIMEELQHLQVPEADRLSVVEVCALRYWCDESKGELVAIYNAYRYGYLRAKRRQEGK